MELSSAAERNHWNLPIPGSKKSSNSGSGSGKGTKLKGQSGSKSNITGSSIPTGHSDGASSGSSGNNNDKQMELMRKRVMEAYAKIRERRRSTSAAYQT